MLPTEMEFRNLKNEFAKFKRDTEDILSNIGRENMTEEMQYYIFNKVDETLAGFDTRLKALEDKIK